MSATKIPRGLALCNPGNIRISGAPWLGKIYPSSDPAFEEFSDVKYGVRAAALIFRNYSLHDGLSTIAQYISRWAPSSDSNPTTGYINFVSSACGCDPNNQYNVQDAGNFSKLLEAVFRFEQGGVYVTSAELAAGIALAMPLSA